MKQKLTNYKKMNRILLLLITTIFIVSCKTKSTITIHDIAGPYPAIAPDTAIDVYWGKTIIDPYRNLENMNDSLVKSWYKAETQFFDTIMSRVTGLDSLKKEIDRYNEEKSCWIDLPRPVGEKLFYSGYSYEKDADNLKYQNNLSETPTLLFDCDSLNKATGKKYSIDYYEPSLDGSYIVFGLSSGGDEQSVIHIMETSSKKILNEKIENANYAMPQWLSDNSGFIYTGFFQDIKNMGSQSRTKTVKLHVLGTSPDNDKIIFSRKESPQINTNEIDFPNLYLFPSSDNVLLALYHGTSDYVTLYYASLSELLSQKAGEIDWKKVISAEDLVPYFALVKNDLFYMSFKENTNGSVLKVNLDAQEKKKVLLDADNDLLCDLIQTKTAIYVTVLENGVNKLKEINIEDGTINNIDLINEGSIRMRPWYGFYSNYQNTQNLLFNSQSWNSDEKVYYYDSHLNRIKETELIPTMKYSVIKDLESYQVQVPSHDGVLVPLTIVHKKGLKKNGQAPVLLETYGCYGFTYSPDYNKSRRAWLERGGIYAYAHVRGGGEKGEEWYKDGYKATKPNSWKDLIACAEYLIKRKYTSSQKLGVTSASAGGITVGRAIIERPDLFKAAVISVGSLNVLRHEERLTKNNVAEYGTVSDSLEFNYLLDMDVYQNIDLKQKYPAILFTAGLNDTRVVPSAPAKAVAKFQSGNNGDNVMLFNVINGGHKNYMYTYGGYGFLLWQLGYPGFELK